MNAIKMINVLLVVLVMECSVTVVFFIGSGL